MKAFRYFDLDNSGKVDRNEFKKVIEKIGIQIFNAQDFDEIFNYYDADGD
jgi:Ca2+-binding EF-hand superfamily protein